MKILQRAMVVLFILLGVVFPPVALSADPPLLKVAVYADGRVSADGRPVTLEELQRSLADLKKAHGAVWYYRENAMSEPNANAMRVVKAIIAAQLPVSMSTKPDFSDVVGPDGKSRPR
jgi:hypothetical protein